MAQIFSLDESVIFGPSRLEAAVTPHAVDQALASHSYAEAINMAALLNTKSVLKRAIDSVELSSIELVQKSIDESALEILMKFLAEEIVSNLEHFISNR